MDGETIPLEQKPDIHTTSVSNFKESLTQYQDDFGDWNTHKRLLTFWQNRLHGKVKTTQFYLEIDLKQLTVDMKKAGLMIDSRRFYTEKIQFEELLKSLDFDATRLEGSDANNKDERRSLRMTSEQEFQFTSLKVKALKMIIRELELGLTWRDSSPEFQQNQIYIV